VEGDTNIATLDGGDGGNGGNEGDAAEKYYGTQPLGGAGGDGGKGGSAGAVTLIFKDATAIFNGDIRVTGGNGGDGGKAGSEGKDFGSLAPHFPGDGGDAGDSAQVMFQAANDIVLNRNNPVAVTSGDGGHAGQNAAYANGGAAGLGGTASFAVGRDVAAPNGASLIATKGTDNGAKAGFLRVSVGRNLEIGEGGVFNLKIAGEDMSLIALNEDYITFGAILFRKGSSFNTDAEVYTDQATLKTASFYRVGSLDIVTSAVWNTAGAYKPDNTKMPQSGDYMRFNMTDIAPGALMGDIGGEGLVNLAAFSPMAQHEAYLAWPERPAWSDDPDNWNYGYENPDTGGTFFASPAFITSRYQTKRLRLGEVILLDRIDFNSVPGGPVTVQDADGNRHYVSGGSDLGPLYDDFAFTSGLRRYYWDVFARDGGGPGSLAAYNYYTADASKIYTQSAAAGMLAAGQTFQTSLAAFENAFRRGLVDHYHMEAAFSGSRAGVKTGSRVELDSWSGALALSRKSEHALGQTVFGIFGELGSGRYETFAEVPRYGDLLGDGEVKTYGGGIFVRNLFPSGASVELSVRGGGIRNEFRLLRDPWIRFPGVHGARSDSSYFGGHLGVARLFAVTDSASVEAYGKYFLTRARANSFVTDFGDPITIDPFDSSRIRAGGRFIQELPPQTLKLYFGLAFEHEFGGRITGRNGEDPIQHAADTEGSSAFGELGLNFSPAGNVTISLAGFGWAGRQKGAGGNALLSFDF
ncbi:MAG: autotransporter outer membrane beta-barrel domain-containing protein, partial [Deltaproteobacteria bacterium]|jgi:hypothetical protein|nr:autotransporter outer membrane beta-barrel domain-containing protein [Deltaproteobacteria bacterium]